MKSVIEHMKGYSFFTIRLFYLLTTMALLFPGHPANAQENVQEIAAAERSEVVESLSKALIKRYAIPEMGLEMAQALRTNLREGKYDNITSGIQFAQALKNDLLTISNDLHFNIAFNAYGTGSFVSDASRTAQNTLQGQVVLRLVPRVEVLPGNIGYIRITGFAAGDEFAGLLAGAFAYVAHTQALIIDARGNSGGDPRGVALLMSYLLDNAPRHIQSLHYRDENGTHVDDFFTSYVGNSAYGEKRPVAVLVSARNASGGEGFPYHVQAFKRGKVIGEQTMGGGHANVSIQLGRRFMVAMPSARAIHPVTGGDWEGTGVTPDIAVPAEEALEAAEQVLFEQLTEMEINPALRDSWAAMAKAIEARRTNRGEAGIPAEDLVGDYAPVDGSGSPLTVLTDNKGGLHVVFRPVNAQGATGQADPVHIGGDRYRYGLLPVTSFFNFHRVDGGVQMTLEVHRAMPRDADVPPRISLYEKTSATPSALGLRPQPAAIDLPSGILSRYTGVYQMQQGPSAVVTLEGGQLMMDVFGIEKVPLFAESETGFFFRIMPMRIEFLPDGEGRYTSIKVVNGNGQEFSMEKKKVY